jgi:hypothetical protein
MPDCSSVTSKNGVAVRYLALALIRNGEQQRDYRVPNADVDHMVSCGLSSSAEALDIGWDHPDHVQSYGGCYDPGRPEYAEYVSCACGAHNGYWTWQPTPVEFATALVAAMDELAESK